jgi:hypothetical protein
MAYKNESCSGRFGGLKAVFEHEKHSMIAGLSRNLSRSNGKVQKTEILTYGGIMKPEIHGFPFARE